MPCLAAPWVSFRIVGNWSGDRRRRPAVRKNALAQEAQGAKADRGERQLTRCHLRRPPASRDLQSVSRDGLTLVTRGDADDRRSLVSGIDCTAERVGAQNQQWVERI